MCGDSGIYLMEDKGKVVLAVKDKNCEIKQLFSQYFFALDVVI
jgi:hypothetical protein